MLPEYCFLLIQRMQLDQVAGGRHAAAVGQERLLRVADVPYTAFTPGCLPENAGVCHRRASARSSWWLVVDPTHLEQDQLATSRQREYIQ